MKQQTAVQSLFDELKKHNLLVKPYTKGVNSLFEKAKQIEKEQIINARKELLPIDMLSLHPTQREKAERYYNETFKK